MFCLLLPFQAITDVQTHSLFLIVFQFFCHNRNYLLCNPILKGIKSNFHQFIFPTNKKTVLWFISPILSVSLICLPDFCIHCPVLVTVFSLHIAAGISPSLNFFQHFCFAHFIEYRRFHFYNSIIQIQMFSRLHSWSLRCFMFC